MRIHNIDRSKKYVVIVSYSKDIFTNPTLDLFFKKLISKNFGILLIAPYQYHSNSFGYSKQITLIEELPFIYKWKSFDWKEKWRLIKRYSKLVAKLLLYKKLAIIGIDPEGSVTAARLNFFLRKKLGCFSFEIIFDDEIMDYSKISGDEKFSILKKLEKKFFKKNDFMVIQDISRQKLICDENQYTPKKVFLIPVSGVPSSEIKPPPDKAKFKMELGIPIDKKVIVFSGSLQEWSGLQKVLEIFEEKWDNRFWLLLHTRFELEKGHLFFDKIADLRLKGLPISLHNKPFDNIDGLADFLSNCDFGLVSYWPMNHPYLGKNIMNIGLSSGKFSLYMMLGLPVIATKCDAYEELLKKYDFGFLVEKMEDIPSKLPLLMDGYALRSESCRNLYSNYLNPEKSISDFVGFIRGENENG